ncbi:MAG: methyltransferase domain-containing protein [Verrucomicrobia bacterium]|nr:methyltransferase domain-containing protein [Verrucomicrobiota bacterium]
MPERTGDRAAPASGWDADLYDDKHAFVWTMSSDLVDLLAPQPGEQILDLGCGTGHLTAKIAGRGAVTLGIDSAESMVLHARQQYPALRFETCDALTMEFAGRFDAIFSNAALHWIRPPEEAARRMHQALKPGGRLVAELGTHGNVQRLVAALGAAREEVTGAGPSASPWYFPTLAEYCSLLQRAGLDAAYALAFDRPTPLEGGEEGLRSWSRMFGERLLHGLDASSRDAVIARAGERLRPALFRDGRWTADYRRLRVVAYRRA